MGGRGETFVGRFGRGATLAATVLLMAPASPALASPASDIAEARETCSRLYEEAEAANEELNGTKVKIDELSDRIAEIESTIDDDRRSLQIQMRNGYKTGAFGLLDGILQSENLPDMIDSAEYSRKIQEENEENIHAVQDATRELHAAKEELEETYARQEAAKEELDAKVREADDYMAGLTQELRESLGVDSQPASWNIPDEISSGTGEAWRDVVLTAAYGNLGGSYVWGGESFRACDCSGLVRWCYKQAGFSVPHYSESLASYCHKSMANAVPGDIAWKPGHVGICIGGGRVIEALNPSRGIVYGTTSSFYSCGSPA